MKLSRRQKRILKRKLKRIAGDAVAVIVGAGMFVGLLIAWANEPMPDWSEYTEENHIGMVQVEGSDTWLTQEEYEQMCKERDAYKAAEQAEEQSYYNAILQSTETPVPTTTAAIGSLDWDASRGATYFERTTDETTWHNTTLKKLFTHGNHTFYTEE